MPIMEMKHDIDPKRDLLEKFANLSDFEPFNNQVLVAIYVRPAQTASGIYLPGRTQEEDKVQGKVGLIVARGPDAFLDPEGKWFRNVNVDIGDWVVMKPSDGWYITLKSRDPKDQGVLCKMIDDNLIRGKVSNPDRAF